MVNRVFVLLPFHLTCLAVNFHHWLSIPPPFWTYVQFLTMWGLFGHTIYFFLSTVDDIFHAYQSLTTTNPAFKRRQNKHLDTFFRAFSFPLATIVAALFWGIYAIDRELMYPKALEAIIPPYINHIQHTFPLISVLLDMILVDHSYHSANLRFDLAMTSAISITYIGLLVYIFTTQGMWVYPFIGLLPDAAKGAFFAFGVALAGVFYYGGMITSSKLWNQAKNQAKKQAKKLA